MLAWLKALRWRLSGWLTLRRHRAWLAEVAARDPVQREIFALAGVADADGIEALTARQRLVLDAWSTHGIVQNGGFRFFLEGDAPLQPAADGLRALGFPAAAGACERVRAALAGRPELTERARRDAAHREAPDGPTPEDLALFDVTGEALRTAVAAFMRGHPRDFPGYPAG